MTTTPPEYVDRAEALWGSTDSSGTRRQYTQRMIDAIAREFSSIAREVEERCAVIAETKYAHHTPKVAPHRHAGQAIAADIRALNQPKPEQGERG